MVINQLLNDMEIDAIRRLIDAEEEVRARSAALREAKEEKDKRALWLSKVAFDDNTNLVINGWGTVIEHNGGTWLVTIDGDGESDHQIKLLDGYIAEVSR